MPDLKQQAEALHIKAQALCRASYKNVRMRVFEGSASGKITANLFMFHDAERHGKGRHSEGQILVDLAKVELSVLESAVVELAGDEYLVSFHAFNRGVLECFLVPISPST